MYILFLIFAAAFLLLKTGLLSINMNINLDLLYFNIPPLKLIVRISPVTICLVYWTESADEDACVSSNDYHICCATEFIRNSVWKDGKIKKM